MNRLRHAYLEIEPGLEPYLSTGHHDDERGVLGTYMLDRPTRQSLGAGFFLLDTPTIVATVDSALAAAMVVLVLQVAEAPRAAAVAGGVAAFLAVWGVLFRLQLYSLRPFRNATPGSRPRRTCPKYLLVARDQATVFPCIGLTIPSGGGRILTMDRRPSAALSGAFAARATPQWPKSCAQLQARWQ
jgi:hypothetical protein